MLEITPELLRDEVRSAIQFRKQVTDASAPLIRQYARNARNDTAAGESSLNGENHAFEFVTNKVATLVYDNPVVACDSPVEQSEPVTVAIEQGLNQWIPDADLEGVLREIAVDLEFDFGVGLVMLDTSPGYEDTNKPAPEDKAVEAADPSLSPDEKPAPPVSMPAPLKPVCRRISPRRFFMDPLATSSQAARYMGHSWVMDKDDALRAIDPATGQKKYDAAAIESLSTECGIEEISDPKVSAQAKDVAQRKRIVGYEVFIPETGMLYTLGYDDSKGADGQSAWLRPPRPYYAPPWGPYTLFGIHLIPDNPYPLPPLAVTADLVDEISKHVAKAKDDAAAAKRMLITDASQKEVNRTMKSGRNNGIYGIKGFNPTMAQMYEVNGPSEESLFYIQWRRDYLQQLSGLTDTRRGNTQRAGRAKTTATQENIAETAANARDVFEQSEFRRCVVRLLRTVAWFLYSSDQVQFPVKYSDPASGQTITGIFQGGVIEGQTHVPFESLRIKIEPFSMEFVDENTRQRRVIQSFELLGNVLAMCENRPYLNIENMCDDIMQLNNVRGGADRYINLPLFRQFQQFTMMMQIQSQTMGGQPGSAGSKGQPSGGKDHAGGGGSSNPHATQRSSGRSHQMAGAA